VVANQTPFEEFSEQISWHDDKKEYKMLNGFVVIKATSIISFQRKAKQLFFRDKIFHLGTM